jgi:hypothetical protein
VLFWLRYYASETIRICVSDYCFLRNYLINAAGGTWPARRLPSYSPRGGSPMSLESCQGARPYPKLIIVKAPDGRLKLYTHFESSNIL